MNHFNHQKLEAITIWRIETRDFETTHLYPSKANNKTKYIFQIPLQQNSKKVIKWKIKICEKLMTEKKQYGEFETINKTKE